MTKIEDEILSRKWFYSFELPSGRRTESYLPAGVESIHTTRLEMLLRALEPVAGQRWSDLTAVDLAGHQGYFSSALARKGCADVLVVDVRPEHIESARLIADVYELGNMRFAVHDVEKLEPEILGEFDVTVMFGLLYHLENPLRALRLARRLTKRVCVIETQIVPNLSGMTDWGSHSFAKPMIGSFALIDETEELPGGESGHSGLCLCPSLEALTWILRRIGFDRVEVIPPPPDGNEQLVHGKRAVVAAYLDSPAS